MNNEQKEIVMELHHHTFFSMIYKKLIDLHHDKFFPSKQYNILEPQFERRNAYNHFCLSFYKF